MRFLFASPHVEPEEMLADPDMVAVRDGVTAADCHEGSVRRPEVAETELIACRIAPDRGVPPAHERIIGEHNVPDFSTENGLGPR
jgi:hypothetical protein